MYSTHAVCAVTGVRELANPRAGLLPWEESWSVFSHLGRQLTTAMTATAAAAIAAAAVATERLQKRQ